MANATHEHGWTAVPRSLDVLVKGRKNPKASTPLTVNDILLPNSELVQQVMQYAKDHLPAETFNHSMRVFYYGKPEHFPRALDVVADLSQDKRY
jgi:cyanamide hydratase